MQDQNATRLPARSGQGDRRSRGTVRVLGLAGLTALALLAASPASADTWHVDGEVLYSNGAPAANATVTLQTPAGIVVSTQTDASGNYDLTLNDPLGSESVTLTGHKGSCSSQPTQVLDRDITKTIVLPGTPAQCS